MRQRSDGRRADAHRRSARPCASACLLALTLVLGSVLGAGLGGCAGTRIDTTYARPYPVELVQGETLDIQVFRRKGRIEFTNTTARSFGPATLWLNQWYSRPIEPLAVGESRSYRLDEFRDEFGEGFRPGGFWATRPPDRLYLAQLEVERGEETILFGLIVVSDRPD